MLKRPTSRRKTSQEGIQLNMVPILDALVTLIAFLLLSMSFLAIVSIESPFPQASSKEIEEKIKEKPLQLTITLRESETELWSPFELIKPQTFPNISGQPNVRVIHDALIEIKKKFPKESKVVVVPYAGANYDMLIALMDAVRMVEAGDSPIFVKNQTTGADELVKYLFPDIIFGNLLGDV